MSTEENTAIKERLQWQSQMALSVLWSSVIVQKSNLFSTKSLRTERRRLDTTKLALGVSTQRPGRVLDHDSSTLPPCLCHRSRPEVGQIARLWHNFLNFLLDCDGGRMKARSCVILKGPVRVGSPSQMVLCRAPTAAPHGRRKQEGKWQKRSLYSHIAPQLEAIPSPLFPARVSVSSEHTEFHLCLFCWGRRVLFFWFDALPAPSRVSEWGIWKTNKRNQTVRRNDDDMKIWMIIYFSSHADININVFTRQLACS